MNKYDVSGGYISIKEEEKNSHKMLHGFNEKIQGDTPQKDFKIKWAK